MVSWTKWHSHPKWHLDQTKSQYQKNTKYIKYARHEKVTLTLADLVLVNKDI